MTAPPDRDAASRPPRPSTPGAPPARRVVVLGSTGSIGTQTLDVARWRGWRVAGLAAGRNAELLLEQAHAFRPELVSCDPAVADAVRGGLPPGTRLADGPEGAREVAALEADAVVAAIAGYAGLEPLLAALRAGRRVALANKEAMVVAGPLVREAARAAGAEIVPVDSEHSALYQCLLGEPRDAVAELVLTASGGPFLRGPADLAGVTPEQALAHPNWSMGPKVTIDSATLFNKGLEVLEAKELFGMPLERIRVVVHPQSLIHGMVRFADGAIKAHVGPHDMRHPIQFGVEAPARPAVPLEPLPLVGTWELLEPDLARFPALRLAFDAGRAGGVAPAVVNAADEVAVRAFLDGRIPFPAIAEALEAALGAVEARAVSWEAIAAADHEAREAAEAFVARRT